MVHDVCETPAIGTKSASLERLWLWKAEIFRQSVLFLLTIGAKERKTAESLIIPHFLSAGLRKFQYFSFFSQINFPEDLFKLPGKRYH
jgi:hypothetical protein